MLFNSFEYLLFLPTAFSLYWFVFKTRKQQNVLLLIASYFFYGWWDWRFLFLIIFSTLVDYSVGVTIGKSNNLKKKKAMLGLSVIINLGLLGFFKYFNFFIDNWVAIWQELGIKMTVSSMNIILPVGISFYTFQTLSYTIDVYRAKLKPTENFVEFASFVSFFPQLVAGPIERATKLLPQFHKKRSFDYGMAISGMKLILWGLVKKVVIADSCAVLVDTIFTNYETESGLSLCMGAIYFSFQIYGDFSGYSDIAIGTSRLFGFNLTQNFNYPYFSRDIAEFWRRWHISLSTWFRDYLYIPLGGSKGTTVLKIKNVFIIFLVSGLWHGANWTFVIWGALNAIFFLPLLLADKNRNNLDIVSSQTKFPNGQEIFQIITTFIAITFAWIFFRAENIVDAFLYIERIFDFSNFIPETIQHKRAIPLVLLFVIIEWFSRFKEYAFILDSKYRYLFYIILAFMVLDYSASAGENSFIYFQF